MTTRTSQPAGGALLISELKEFAGFSKATQRYVRRSLDIAFGQDRLPSFASFRFLYERLMGASCRPWLPAAFCAAAALPHLHPDRRRTLLQSISESAATAPGWSSREPVFWPEWVEKVDVAAAV